MDNLNELRAIWLTAKTDSLPDSKEMVMIIKKFRNRKLLKIISQVVTATVAVVTIMIVGFTYKSAMVTTRIGEVLIGVAGLMLVTTNINSFNRFYRLKECSNKDFIKFLEQTRLRQLFYYKRTQVAAMFVCSAGLAFYLYEGVYQSTILTIVVYTLTAVYILIGWFVVRPWFFKREQKKLNATMERLETISKQL
jgi:hypothetical protein